MNEKLIKQFSELYLPKEIDFHGLKLYHELWTEKTIDWTLENPKGLSYNKNVLEGYLEEYLRDFGKLIGFIPQQENYKSLSRLDIKPDFFINKNDEKKITELCKTIKKFQFKDVESDCKVNKIKLRPGYDFWEVDVEIMLINPTEKIKSRGSIWKKNLYGDDLKEIIHEIYSDENFIMEYSTELMSPVYIFLRDHVTLYDSEYMYTQFHIGFKDNEGNTY